MDKILIVDDDRDMCLLLSRFLTRKGYEAVSMHTGVATMEWIAKNKPALVLLDFRLEDTTGATLLTSIKEAYYDVPVIIITGYSDVKDAVEVIKTGAYDYITKPLFPDEILLTITKALGENKNSKDNSIESQDVKTSDKEPEGRKKTTLRNNPEIIINSPDCGNIVKQVDLVAPTNYSVIIYGESGSGKEAIAKQIHQKSKRSSKPFVAIDCGALSKELAGSELFGHEKGAFTGALFQKTGAFESANGGTIFLDEVANLSYDIQVSLLRVIQERSIRRLGGNKEIPLDIRIIVASNESLWDATKEGKFREDLYHRFNEFCIELPPLRERKNDIMFFAKHFLELTNAELGKNIHGFTKEVEKIFSEYIWYGNLRELKNVVKRATLLTDETLIDVKSLPFEISNFSKLQFDITDNFFLQAGEPNASDNANGKSLKNANLDSEYSIIMDVLKQTNFNKSKAAQILRIDRKTLYNKINQYNALKSGKAD